MLSEADAALSDEEKITKAQEIVCDDQYQNVRTEITSDVA